MLLNYQEFVLSVYSVLSIASYKNPYLLRGFKIIQWVEFRIDAFDFSTKPIPIDILTLNGSAEIAHHFSLVSLVFPHQIAFILFGIIGYHLVFVWLPEFENRENITIRYFSRQMAFSFDLLQSGLPWLFLKPSIFGNEEFIDIQIAVHNYVMQREINIIEADMIIDKFMKRFIFFFSGVNAHTEILAV